MNFQELRRIFPTILKDEPLKRYCTFNVGGPAEYFLQVKSKEELLKAIKYAHEHGIKYFIFGGGSNLLFPDEGLKSLIIKNLSHKIEVDEDKVIAESGAITAQILSISLHSGLTGLEELIGLPGTIGGAVRGNAGAYNTEIKDVLDEVEVYKPGYETVRLKKENLDFSYRHSTFKLHPDWTILEVTLKLKKADTVEAKESIKNILGNRKGKQPPGWNTGSFFKNPSKEKPAGWLIEQVGLKGFRIGDAQISPIHANFFMNLGSATAKDILALAALAKQKVAEKFGIELEEEVMIL